MISEPILLVDDERDVRDSLTEVLRMRGYTVESAASGQEALTRMGANPFPVVLTDFQMPGGMTGLDLIAAVKQRHPETLSILITAHATLDTSIEALKRGAYDLIQKPFRASEVEVVLDRALDHARLLRKVHAYQTELETRILDRTRDLQEAHREALALCDLTLQNLDAPGQEALLESLLDRLATRWSPDGLGCYRRDGDGLRAVVRRGPRPLPASLDIPYPGPLRAPELGYPEARFVPLGDAGWLYLGFGDRSTFSEADPGFLLLTRHLELALRVR
ncbi:response regulator [Geothrix sp. 21YS21S-4]|uniref:response regulator n=1 Tax=Geothrix sp. 21YS21S-4 TaxID=3068889 RepID=UPI0027B8B841|nr:response regulator [Geothrix sp. 21YS21S-4]